ncbi:BldC family transcriptional regulator [Actinotalea sp.]|uniref:BldC family transcriptional regulator n=1 Tax=Actinotalea sp. TaxID=1872145 RepID=UPI002C0DD584|nr:BldC family transcriptional regulator [Actinotalea sp.]HQY34252.1 BldC family transcriptional regulator [Actinotalea sp.]HRA49472.1 BldC family transcriptional regulator [Actinotalea sp.]
MRTIPAPHRPVTTATVEALLTPGEVAMLFRVDPKTVTRWADAGKISTVRTLGGHRRFSEREIRGLLGAVPSQASAQH